MTATVQTYQLNEQVYQRANNFTTNGQITFDSLQSSLINNSLILSRSLTEDVIIDKTGITLTDQENPLKRVRIVSGGVFLSDHLDINGNIVWESGITGEGINTNLLTAGQIDVGKINIMSGAYPTFSWDSTGLYAYSYTGAPGSLTMDKTSYVRFNQDGVKGVNAGTDIFRLDWKGFYLRTVNGAITIDSATDSINIYKGANEIVKLGLLTGITYGLRVKNNIGTTMLQIDSAGTAYFAGELRAATGTFSGSLNAASGTFTGTLSGAYIDGGTISGAVIKGGSFRNVNQTQELTISNNGEFQFNSGVKCALSVLYADGKTWLGNGAVSVMSIAGSGSSVECLNDWHFSGNVTGITAKFG